jgi:hypothetical protein
MTGGHVTVRDVDSHLSDLPAHRTAVVEKGSFATALCSCGWSAPARRSRDKSRKDADAHYASTSSSSDSSASSSSLPSPGVGSEPADAVPPSQSVKQPR